MADDDRPVRVEGEATPAFLARILVDVEAPAWMVTLAAEGHYDDFLSPLATPELQLHSDAKANGLPQIAAWVELGVFDATKAESDAWAASPDGQAAFGELLGGLSKRNRAQRREDDRRRRRRG